MAVRVRLILVTRSGRSVETVALLNGGFELPDPHLLLPDACARRLFEPRMPRSSRLELDTAGGRTSFSAVAQGVRARVHAHDRDGSPARFHVLITTTDDEVLVSDAGIDALGVRIESFAPGRWRFLDEARVRDTEAPQHW